MATVPTRWLKPRGTSFSGVYARMRPPPTKALSRVPGTCSSASSRSILLFYLPLCAYSIWQAVHKGSPQPDPIEPYGKYQQAYCRVLPQVRFRAGIFLDRRAGPSNLL